jgi:hypothetical protein
MTRRQQLECDVTLEDRVFGENTRPIDPLPSSSTSRNRLMRRPFQRGSDAPDWEAEPEPLDADGDALEAPVWLATAVCSSPSMRPMSFLLTFSASHA